MVLIVVQTEYAFFEICTFVTNLRETFNTILVMFGTIVPPYL